MATLEITEIKTVDAKFLKVEASVRYWEDASVNGHSDEDGSLIPCRHGNDWSPVIDVDTGIIQDWPENTVASIHYKVCDEGVYTLSDVEGAQLVRKEGYVPACMSPGGSGYGDYIIMTVGPDGAIQNWSADLDDFGAAHD